MSAAHRLPALGRFCEPLGRSSRRSVRRCAMKLSTAVAGSRTSLMGSTVQHNGPKRASRVRLSSERRSTALPTSIG